MWDYIPQNSSDLRFIKHTPGNKQYDETSMLDEYRRTGDLEVLGKLYQGYMSLVYGVCMKYLKDEDASKDAVMQIFEQLIKKLQIHEVLNFKSWLYMLCRNHCLMQLRVTEKHPTVSFEETYMERDAPLHLEYEDTKERQLGLMESCIEKLPGEQKETIKLFYLEQKCYKEVSDVTGYDLNKVKSYIQNGKRNLKICMERKNSGE